ncbi:SDR family oxidoreductase [Saccharopolyspora sp. NPDC049426]|uniref:SDR family oxidoreductase n=1 Tax=Saccharopolyspora sp. NPDC049426 TaxID=3155652 RepID=UPI0034338BE3
MTQAPPAHGLLNGRTAVVTAAAGTGIGSAVARRMLEEGAQVLISDRHERRLAETCAELAELPGAKVASVACDVTDETQVQRMFDTATSTFGQVDVVVNNAGLGGTASILEMTDEQWDKVVDVTLGGTFRCTRAATRLFRDQGNPGVVVNNASVVGWRAQAGQSHYAAAKAGVMALTRCAAMDAAELGVRINAVAPSLVMHENLAKVTSDDLLTTLTEREAFGRSAEPWEIANVIVFLASDYSTYLTGEVISVSNQHP